MKYKLSENIKFVLKDGDIVWPTTMDSSFRLVTQKDDYHILGEDEHPVSEEIMVEGILIHQLPSRWRSKINIKRKTANYFSITSPSVKEVHLNVGGVWIQYK